MGGDMNSFLFEIFLKLSYLLNKFSPFYEKRINCIKLTGHIILRNDVSFKIGSIYNLDSTYDLLTTLDYQITVFCYYFI